MFFVCRTGNYANFTTDHPPDFCAAVMILP
ncbi:Uncharacterised protein [Mycobacterium tuberculosis]|nr:Uncharacterised protein [Mycobacterium tuberculosis]